MPGSWFYRQQRTKYLPFVGKIFSLLKIMISGRPMVSPKRLTVSSLWLWTVVTETAVFERLLFIPFLFLSGLLAPLSAFPPGVRAVVQWTPFPYLIDFPARVLAGDPVNVWVGFAAQLAWFAVLLPLVLVLWKAGVRRYSAMGA